MQEALHHPPYIIPREMKSFEVWSSCCEGDVPWLNVGLVSILKNCGTFALLLMGMVAMSLRRGETYCHISHLGPAVDPSWWLTGLARHVQTELLGVVGIIGAEHKARTKDLVVRANMWPNRSCPVNFDPSLLAKRTSTLM